MSSALDRVQNGLEKLKQMGENPSNLDAREKAVKQLKVLSLL